MTLNRETGTGLALGVGLVIAGAVVIPPVSARMGTRPVSCAAVTVDPQPESLIIDRLIWAFAEIESSHRPQVRGKKGEWGLYQFAPGRWRECGGDARQWGKAGAAEQTRVMRLAIERYARRMPRGLTVEQQVCWIGRCHNGGIRTVQHNTYTRELWRAYRSCGVV